MNPWIALVGGLVIIALVAWFLWWIFGRAGARPETQLAVLLMVPALAVIVLIALYPLFQTFLLSLQDYNLKRPHKRAFVGFQNYIDLFTDKDFIQIRTQEGNPLPQIRGAVPQTLYFTVVSVAIEFVLGLGVAMVINRRFKGRGLVRAAVLVPWAVPTVISARMWQLMYHDQFGVINDIMMRLGLIDKPQTWLANPKTAMFAIIATDVWKTTPFMALLLLAGLQIISKDLYEAASIDGAGPWRRFWKITLPLLRPAILVALIFRTLDAFRVFDVIFVMTRGASGTESLAVRNQKVLFQFLDFGYGSTISIVIFLFILVFSILYIRVLGLRLAVGE